MGILQEVNDMAQTMGPDVQMEMQTLADYWTENGADMSEDELMDAIGNDLEQLEYSPMHIQQMLPQIMDMVRQGR